MSTIKEVVKDYVYKGYELQYRSRLGWTYKKPNSKTCTIVYVLKKADAIKYLEEDIKNGKI